MLIAGWSSPVARQAHNLKAAGSNPAPATKIPKKSIRMNTTKNLCKTEAIRVRYINEITCGEERGTNICAVHSCDSRQEITGYLRPVIKISDLVQVASTRICKCRIR